MWKWTFLQKTFYVSVRLILSVRLAQSRSFTIFYPSLSASPLSPPTCFSLFHQLSQLYRPLHLCAALLSYPDCFISLGLSSLQFAFCSPLSPTRPCYVFSSSDPTLRIWERSGENWPPKNLQLKGLRHPVCVSRSLQHCETFRLSSSLSEKQLVSRSTCLFLSFFFIFYDLSRSCQSHPLQNFQIRC